MISPRDDLSALRQRFLQQGRVLIPGIFEPAFAQSVLDAACEHAGWLLVTRIEGRHREFDAAQMEQVPKDRLQTFDELVAQEARKGFQYRFERHLLYDNLRAGALAEGPLRSMAEALNSDAFIGLLHTVMSEPYVPGETFCDGQLTRYRAGHFLTSHDDGLPQFNRIAAFVVNLTPGWSADLGGLLMFTGADGHVEEAFTPKFNTLSLFRVPQPHAVSAVAPFARGARHAVTGWLRRGQPPA
ncbi:2OG-Fe(II) oxygenase family protein [Hyphomonas sp.]|uniref:2OG-Fe(II) oxygenase n=1 Tax=Hyphomonas sp. TaxID=87 RepID=UPI0025B9EAEA|nr:2OG-Fe(II) oxygenase family protein [Hyphomonas sp.]